MPELPLIRLEKLPPLSGSGKITFPALDEAAGSFSHRGGASTFPTGFHLVFPPVKQACVRESGKLSRPVRQVISFSRQPQLSVTQGFLSVSAAVAAVITGCQ